MCVCIYSCACDWDLEYCSSLRYTWASVSRKKGSFLRPVHVRDFVKKGELFCTQVRSMGVENALTTHKIYAALTRSDSRSDWASESAAAK